MKPSVNHLDVIDGNEIVYDIPELSGYYGL